MLFLISTKYFCKYIDIRFLNSYYFLHSLTQRFALVLIPGQVGYQLATDHRKTYFVHFQIFLASISLLIFHKKVAKGLCMLVLAYQALQRHV